LKSTIDADQQQEFMTKIVSFVERAGGLSLVKESGGAIRVVQKIDGKAVCFSPTDLEDVLLRSDTEAKEFIQINFSSGKKILVTRTLIGFKPLALQGLDSGKLPRVVTTPDVMSVFEAIQDALHSDDADEREVAVLKKVFEAVLAGGESVGFDLSLERSWLARIPNTLSRTAA
jgi:hypothetical protein